MWTKAVVFLVEFDQVVSDLIKGFCELGFS